MKRVVIYARVSTDEQQQLDALDRQVQELTEFVESNKEWVLIKKYVDEGKSGTTSTGRSDYNKLCADLVKGKFDLIVVKDESRLMRNSYDWQIFKNNLIKNDKQLFFFMENRYYTPDNDLLHNIKVAVAEEYSKELSRKINTAAHYAQKNGTIYGNSRIYGYKKDKAKLVIDEEEAEVVRLVFELYIQGKGFRAIQNVLTEKGIYSSTGTPFSLTTMKRMLKQEKYCGVIVSHKTQTDFYKKRVDVLPEDEWVKIFDPERCPPILSREVFDKANDLLKQRCQENGAEEAKKRGAFKGNNYPLSGKIYCGKCGKVYWHEHYITKVNALERNIWQCSSYKAYGIKNGCSNRKLDDAKIMLMLRQILCEMIHNDDVKSVVDMVANINDNANNDNGKRVRDLKAKLTRLEKRKENLVISLTDGVIDKEEFLKAKQQTIEDISRLTLEIIEAEKEVEGNVTNNFQKIKDFLDLSIDNPSQIGDNVIKDIIDKIVVDNDNISVYMVTTKYPSVTYSGQIRPHTQIYKTKKRRTIKQGKNSYLYFFVYI